MEQKQLPEATSQLVSSFEETTRAVIESLTTVQERNLQVVQRQVLDWIEALKEQVQANQHLAQELEEQAHKQQEAFHNLAQQAVESSFDVMAASFAFFSPSLKLTENVRICLLALASRYPHHLVDINEAVLGPQSMGAEGWWAEDLIEWLQTMAPEVLQATARLEVTPQRKGIYLLDRSEEEPAFWVHCGVEGEKMPPYRGNMAARQAEQVRRRDEAAEATAGGQVQLTAS